VVTPAGRRVSVGTRPVCLGKTAPRFPRCQQGQAGREIPHAGGAPRVAARGWSGLFWCKVTGRQVGVWRAQDFDQSRAAV